MHQSCWCDLNFDIPPNNHLRRSQRRKTVWQRFEKTNEDTKAYYVIMERAGGLENPSGVQWWTGGNFQRFHMFFLREALLAGVRVFQKVVPTICLEWQMYTNICTVIIYRIYHTYINMKYKSFQTLFFAVCLGTPWSWTLKSRLLSTFSGGQGPASICGFHRCCGYSNSTDMYACCTWLGTIVVDLLFVSDTRTYFFS